MGITAKDLTQGAKGMTAAEMLTAFEAFLKKVETNGYEVVPTISAFADYMKFSRADVHEWFRLHPTESGQMRQMCADTIASGAMMKKYETRITSFALKNWCGWEESPSKDKGRKSKEKADEKATKEALDRYIAEEKQILFRSKAI